MDTFRKMHLHKKRKPLLYIAKLLNPITRGVIGYYCKIWSDHTWRLWNHLNDRLIKWAIWQFGLSNMAAVHWFRSKYKENPNLFYHWKIAHPWDIFYTFLIEQEEPYEGRLSQPVPILRDTVLWERRGETPLCDPTSGNAKSAK